VTARLRRQFARGSVWVRTAVYDALDRPGPTEQARPGYALLDAGAGVSLGSRVEVHVVGRNLADKSYLVSPDARATLAPGRSGAVTVAVAF
jgi:outer membrane receptor protein involved in Fe transport